MYLSNILLFLLVDINLTYYDLFSTSTCFVLFEITFLFKFFSLSSKSVFLYKIKNITFAF